MAEPKTTDGGRQAHRLAEGIEITRVGDRLVLSISVAAEPVPGQDQRDGVFETTLRNKFLTQGCRTPDQFIRAYAERAAQMLRFKANNVKYMTGADEDRAEFRTRSAAVAKAEGFNI